MSAREVPSQHDGEVLVDQVQAPAEADLQAQAAPGAAVAAPAPPAAPPVPASSTRGGIWLETAHWILLPVAPGHAVTMARLHARNGMRFDMASTIDPGMDTPEYWKPVLADQQDWMRQGQAVHLIGFLKGAQGAEIGCTLSFGGIVHEDFRACTMGYKLDASLEGRGLMHEAAEAAVDKVFAEFELNRIMANHLPQNLRSARLLRRLGFSVEGYARDFMMMNGQWRDAVLLSVLARDWRAARNRAAGTGRA